MSNKYRFEAASDNEAAFIISEYNPRMTATIKEFRTHAEMDAYTSAQLTVQVRRQLPILLELVNSESNDQELNRKTLVRMAEWYYYTHLTKQR
ncbi:hypothetical protein [Telluribacter sp.]|jgi:hypothetical protein|uniref:hypothetical protein n=1 Tax=Telluribacter sp. TaxID=1978767 RepID=UPI002E0E6BCC|nr:hypothetical protein [Telluribacter sp.]